MFLSIRSIPKVSWSSSNPLNFKPKLSTFLFLCIGLSLFGLGEGLIMISYIGNSPWQVLAQGISLHADFSIGFITFLISFAVLSLWIFLGQKPGIGTFLNAIIIAAIFGWILLDQFLNEIKILGIIIILIAVIFAQIAPLRNNNSKTKIL